MADKIAYRYDNYGLWNLAVMRLALFLLSYSLFHSSALYAEDEAPLPVIKLSPVVRENAVNPYAELPCDRLDAHKPQSEEERHQLAARKRQCLNKYRQFIPADGVR